MEGARETGNHYEGVAARYLQSKGVTIIERNFYIRGGEIDLVGIEDGVLVFFEVRFRANNSLVDPLSSITPTKQRRLLRTAAFYLHRYGQWDTLTRIDVIGISPGNASRYRVQWLKNAIQAD